MTKILFCDTETSGLAADADIWEFAGILREEDGRESEHHLFIEHDIAKCAELPPSFREDHLRRFPGATKGVCLGRGSRVMTRDYAAGYIEKLTAERPHIVGAVPNFDTERLTRLLEAHGCRWGGHYHLIDVENLAVGYLAGIAGHGHSEVTCGPICGQGGYKLPPLPWDSDEISRAIGVEPPSEGVRHTAMGDATWTKAMYDAICGGGVR